MDMVITIYVTCDTSILSANYGCGFLPGFPQALEIMENLENHLKKSMHGKIMEFEKTWIIME